MRVQPSPNPYWRPFTYRQSLLFLAGIAFVFCFLLLGGGVIQITSGPGSDGNVACNGQPMLSDEVCQHMSDSLNEGSYTYDQQAQYQANLRAQSQANAQGLGVGTGVTGSLGLILLLWGLSIKPEPTPPPLNLFTPPTNRSRGFAEGAPARPSAAPHRAPEDYAHLSRSEAFEKYFGPSSTQAKRDDDS